MLRGRPRKSKQHHQLAGNPGKRDLPSSPQPSGELPQCPDWLDEVARKKWDQLVPDLSRLGLLTTIDGDALAGYCIAWSELRHATQTLAEKGRHFSTESGYLAPHPAVAQQRSALRALKDYAAQFGLDPLSRSRLDVTPPSEEEDEMDKFLRGDDIGHQS